LGKTLIFQSLLGQNLKKPLFLWVFMAKERAFYRTETHPSNGAVLNPKKLYFLKDF
jgi:hypothetical protein